MKVAKCRVGICIVAFFLSIDCLLYYCPVTAHMGGRGYFHNDLILDP